MAYNKNGNYTQEQITNLLYEYMVEGQSAAYICKNILGMPESEIGNPRFAWRKLQRYYNSYGFKKRYNNGSAFRNISKGKLRKYVSLYWDKNATEKDLIAFFPEIFDDLNEAKRIEGERELLRENNPNTGRTSSTNSGSSHTSFEKRQPQNYTNYHPAQNTSSNRSTTRSNYTNNFRTENASKSQRTYRTNTPENPTSPIYNRNESGNEINSSDSGSILAIVVLIIVIIAICKSGIIPTVFHGITNGLKKLFWILELFFFYGGIILFVISLFKKTTRSCWKSCVGISALGLCFGFFSTGNFLTGIILGIVSLAFITATC